MKKLLIIFVVIIIIFSGCKNGYQPDEEDYENNQKADEDYDNRRNIVMGLIMDELPFECNEQWEIQLKDSYLKSVNLEDYLSNEEEMLEHFERIQNKAKLATSELTVIYINTLLGEKCEGEQEAFSKMLTAYNKTESEELLAYICEYLYAKRLDNANENVDYYNLAIHYLEIFFEKVLDSEHLKSISKTHYSEYAIFMLEATGQTDSEDKALEYMYQICQDSLDTVTKLDIMVSYGDRVCEKYKENTVSTEDARIYLNKMSQLIEELGNDHKDINHYRLTIYLLAKVLKNKDIEIKYYEIINENGGKDMLDNLNR